jgi:hypothetical protein
LNYKADGKGITATTETVTYCPVYTDEQIAQLALELSEIEG